MNPTNNAASTCELESEVCPIKHAELEKFKDGLYDRRQKEVTTTTATLVTAKIVHLEDWKCGLYGYFLEDYFDPKIEYNLTLDFTRLRNKEREAWVAVSRQPGIVLTNLLLTSDGYNISVKSEPKVYRPELNMTTEEAFDKYGALMRWYVKRLVVTNEVTKEFHESYYDDMIHDLYLSFEKRGGIIKCVRYPEKVKSYMTRSARLWFYKWFRGFIKHKRLNDYDLNDYEWEKIANPFDNPAQIYEIKNLWNDFKKVVKTLSPSVREVAEKAFIQQLSHDEIAETLGISKKASYTRLSRAREELREKYPHFLEVLIRGREYANKTNQISKRRYRRVVIV